MAFLQEVDPAVRLAATQAADSSQEYVCNKLLYSAVNDPSDAVRAWSNFKLTQSPIPNFKREGYKGVRDDGRFARMILLEQLAAHPSDEHRNALRLAVADTDPEVRALALKAFASIPGGVAADEVSNTFEDHDPGVQYALVELALGKKLALPKKTLDELRASPNQKVASKAKELGG